MLGRQHLLQEASLLFPPHIYPGLDQGPSQALLSPLIITFTVGCLHLYLWHQELPEGSQAQELTHLFAVAQLAGWRLSDHMDQSCVVPVKAPEM